MLCLQTYFKGYWVLWSMRLLNQGHFPYPLNVDLISLPLSCHLTVVWTAARAMTLPLASHVFVLSRHVPGVAYESFEAECNPLTPDTQCCNYFLLFPLLFWKIYIIILFWWLFDHNSILKYKKSNIIWYFYLLGKWKVHKTFLLLGGDGA